MSKPKGTLKSIAGRQATKRTLERRVEDLEKLKGALTNHVIELETKIANAFATLKEIVTASNNSTLVVSCVERFLDGKFGEDWDAGVRKEAEARLNLLKRRKALMLRMQIERKTLKLDERSEIATEIWAIARELDLRADDLPAVVSLHLQNGDVERALDVIEEIRRDKVLLSGEVAGLVEQLVTRCIALAEKTSNEILVARAKSIASIISSS